MSESASKSAPSSRTIWTVGHSNRDVDEFVAMLLQSSVTLVADVRRFPGSRRNPHFTQENLQRTLGAAGIDYQHFPGLGGRRKPLPDSPNDAWRVQSFNAYADHMLTDEFQASLANLEQVATLQSTTIMCAEAVPWRCHRRLIADALIVRGWSVLDIFSAGRVKPHTLTDFIHVDDGHITYPQDTLGHDD